MRTLSLLLLVLACSCSGPNEHTHTADEPKSATPATPTLKTMGRLSARVSTIGDVAEAVGVHPYYIYLGNVTCGMRWIDCKEPLGMAADSCSVVLAREWCRVNDCTQGPENVIEDDPCMEDVIARSCDDMDRPMDCPYLNETGKTLVPSVWPDGPVEDPLPIGQTKAPRMKVPAPHRRFAVR